MFGKYQTKFVAKIILFIICIPQIIFSNTNSISSFLINGFSGDILNENYNKALRLHGIADFFFKKKSYAQAVSYYEEAQRLLPNEPDIPFQLAQIYQHEKLWVLAKLYYEETIRLLKDPVNKGKSQLNSYISEIRIAELYYEQDNHEKAQSLIQNIRKNSSLLKSLYPSAWKELEKFNNIYPEIAVRQEQEKT